MFDNVASSIEHIRTGRLRALAVTTTTRWEGLPDIPTMSDFVPGFETGGLAGIGTPKGTPTGIVEKLNKGIDGAITDVKVKIYAFPGRSIALQGGIVCLPMAPRILDGRRVRCVAITMTSERKIMRREDCYVCYKHILSCEASIFVQCALGSSTGTLSSDFGTFVGERYCSIRWASSCLGYLSRASVRHGDQV